MSPIKTFLQKINISVLAFFLLFLLYSPSYAVPFISHETEINMGKEADPQISEQFGIYQDKTLQLYVNEIGQKLLGNLADKVFPRYFFKVVDSSDINAFALPGGYVYVTRGLLAALNSEAELAGVLGHEIGHITMHHGAKMMVRMIGAQILSIGGAIASPKNAGNWIRLSTAMFQQINNGYGREAELQSDAQGLMNSFDSGYDPHDMVLFLKNLRRHEIMTGQAYHSFQATHPETKERIIKANLISTSLLNRNKNVKSERNRYLSQLLGLPCGGKRHSEDSRNRDKPKYIDIYEIREGDTLESIAVKELGEKRHALEIAVLNGIKETTPLKKDDLLKIVKSGIFTRTQTLHIQPDPF
ncbi:MAG: M48 family metalloprotease [Nitrospinota bacterium]|nr:M48 family metalloprotease [Nitrospinota bacterium]